MLGLIFGLSAGLACDEFTLPRFLETRPEDFESPFFGARAGDALDPVCGLGATGLGATGLGSGFSASGPALFGDIPFATNVGVCSLLFVSM